MPTPHTRIAFDEFSANLTRIVDRVVRDGTTIVVEKDAGTLVEVKPVPAPTSRHQPVTQTNEAALRAAAFGWAEIDIDTYRQDLAEADNKSPFTG
jgi:hypothetical protein